MKLKRPANWPITLPAKRHDPNFFCIKRTIALIFLLSFGIPLTSQADYDVTLRWDANNPTPEGYRVYGREEGKYYDYDDPWWQGDNTFTQCTIDGLSTNKSYLFVVRAFTGDDMSGDSNEVRYACSDYDHVSPAAGGSGSGCFIQLLFRFGINHPLPSVPVLSVKLPCPNCE